LTWWWCLPLGLGAAVAAASLPAGRWLSAQVTRTEALSVRVAAATRRHVTLRDDGDLPPSSG